MDSRSQKALLSTEIDSSICYGVTIREVKMMDQFAPDFKDLIKRLAHQTLFVDMLLPE